MTATELRVGTRGSALALAQTHIAVEQLRVAAAGAGIQVQSTVVQVTTTGDREAEKPFSEIGPKGMFATELQQALLDGRIDVAVHSLKDLEAHEPEGLAIAAVLEREDPRDVLVSSIGAGLAEMPHGSVVATSSVRRIAQLLVARPDLEVVPIRGNVDTRLAKLRRGDAAALVLAGAGLLRLGRGEVVTEWLDPLRFVPAPGQGAVAVETRADRLDGDLAWVVGADHRPTSDAVAAERVFMGEVEGGCRVPLGAWARVSGSSLVCDGFVSAPDASRVLTARATGSSPEQVGRSLATDLLAQGAAELIASLR